MKLKINDFRVNNKAILGLSILLLLVVLPFTVANTMPIQSDVIIYFDNSEEVSMAINELVGINKDSMTIKYDSLDMFLKSWRSNGAIYIVGHGSDKGISIIENHEITKTIAWKTIIEKFSSIRSNKILFVACNSYEGIHELEKPKNINYYYFQGNVDAILAARYQAMLRYYSESPNKSYMIFDQYLERVDEIRQGKDQFLLGCIFTACFDDGGGGGGSPPSPPGPVRNFDATLNKDNGITLIWDDPNTGGSVSSYTIYRRTVGSSSWGILAVLSSSANSYNDLSASYSTSYEYRIKAENTGGSSSYKYSSDYTCRYSYNSYLTATQNRIAGFSGPDQHMAISGSYAYFYLLNTNRYGWAGEASWVAHVLAWVRESVIDIVNNFQEIDQMTEIGAMVSLVIAAVSASFAWVPGAIVIAMTALLTALLLIVLNILVNIGLNATQTFAQEFEEIMNMGAPKIHQVVFAFIAIENENSACSTRIANMHSYTSNGHTYNDGALVNNIVSNILVGNSYTATVEALRYEQYYVIQREYDAWLPTVAQNTVDLMTKFAYVTFGKVGDSSIQYHIHVFVNEMEDLGYSNPDFFNKDTRLYWTLHPLLDDFWGNERSSSGTYNELYEFYQHARSEGVNI